MYLCELCNRAYKRPNNLSRHFNLVHTNEMDTTNKTNKTNGPKKTIKRKRKRHNKFCIVCCKTFTTIGSFKYHMRAYHAGMQLDDLEGVNAEPFKWKNPGGRKSSKFNTVTSNPTSNDIFENFENEIPSELRDDTFRCIICNSEFPTNNEFVEHEKIHFETDASNNVDDILFYKLEVTNKGSLTNPIMSYETVSEITCDNCPSKFRSVINYDEHKKICRKNYEINVLAIMNIIQKETRVQRSTAHAKALYEFPSNQQQIDCEICGKCCNKIDHIEYNRWWNGSSLA